VHSIRKHLAEESSTVLTDLITQAARERRALG
jgi:hypothetical protein